MSLMGRIIRFESIESLDVFWVRTTELDFFIIVWFVG